MAEMPGMKLTRAGLNLLAKALTGKELHFTRAFAGDGILDADVDVMELEGLLSSKRELPIQAIEISENVGTALIILEMNNQGLTQGFFLREYGLFAKDPDTEEEILYSYRNVGDNASYLPAQDGPDVVQYTLTLVTVIDQAENVTAYVQSNDSYVTHTLLEARLQGLFKDPDNLDFFWTYKDGDVQKLRPSSLQTVKDLIVGKHDFGNLNGRLEVVENAIAQMLLTFEDIKQYPDYMNFIVEDFKDTSQLDMTQVRVTSIITGDDSLDVESITGLIPGSVYMLSDSVTNELVQIKTINRENGIYRIILSEPVKGAYLVDSANLYRTSTAVTGQNAGGSESVRQYTWYANYDWEGLSSDQELRADLAPSVSKQNNYNLSENISITGTGYFQLAIKE